MSSENDINIIRPVYERELEALTQHLKRFSDKWPDAAQDMMHSNYMPEDPDIRILLEGVAYLCARIQHRIDDNYESLCLQVLQIFYPDFVKPIPASGVIKFDTSVLKKKFFFPKGSEIQIDQKSGNQSNVFNLCKDTVLPPLTITNAELISESIPEPISSANKGARSVIKITFQANIEKDYIVNIIDENIELYIDRNAIRSNTLIDFFMLSIVSVMINSDGCYYTLPVEVISWPMFDSEGSILNDSPNFFEPLRLLKEFSIYSELFSFLKIDISTIKEKLKSNTVDIYFVLDDISYSLERDVGPDHFFIGCAPIINKYIASISPIKVDHKTRDVPVELNHRNKKSKIYDIEKVADVTDVGNVQYIPSLFSSTYSEVDYTLSWQFINYPYDHFQFCDLRSRDEKNVRILSITGTAYDLNAGGLPISSQIRPLKQSIPCKAFLINPTSKVQKQSPFLQKGWRLLSALQMNMKGFTIDKEEAGNLQSLLNVFFLENKKSYITSIESLICSKDLRPDIYENTYYLSQGTKFKIKIENSKLKFNSVYLLSLLLNRILSFVRPFGDHSQLTVIICNNGKEEFVLDFPGCSNG